MTCREAMRTHFDFCVGEERLNDALEIMSATGGNVVAVVETREGMHLMGTITARQAAVRLGLADLRPSDVMCRELADPRCAKAAPDDDAAAALAALRRTCASAIPVVENGKLVGLLLAEKPAG